MAHTRNHCPAAADDMPPLVEAPASMTYTFLAEMPLSFDPTSSLETTSTSIAPSATIEELDDQPYTFSGPTRTYHGKRRGASYIPRPPNAFILFRSSFIHEQQVPINVEGSHSNLSKIVGLYWKNLPKSERDTWEAKAAQAQVEHRRRYPDWRFQPGANAAANAKERRYVLDSGGGDGSGGGRRRRTSVRTGTKDPPDRGGDEEFEDEEDEEEDILDNDNDSDYEEGASSRRKGKGKRKVKVRARSTRGRRPTGKVENESKSAPVTIGDKERNEERIKRIVGFLVEGKKGAELEEAVEEWDMNGSRSSTAARYNVDADKDEGSGTIKKLKVQAPRNTANVQLKFRTKPLPLIITVNPSPPSAPFHMLSSTPHSPAGSLLSPVLTLSPIGPPPSSPDLQQEEVQGMKRSLSAPAPRTGVPQVQSQSGYMGYIREERTGQLGYRHAQGGERMRKRNCSSASVPGSIGGDAVGERNRAMPRRETVSLPLTRMDAGSMRWGFLEPVYGENQTSGVSDLTTQGLGAQEQGGLMESASIEGYVSPTSAVSAFPGEGGYMSAGPNSNITSDDPSSPTITRKANYYTTSPASSLSAVTASWDQQRRQEQEVIYATTSTHWWPPTVSASPSTTEQFEPVRGGSFEQAYDYGNLDGYGTSGEAGYNKVFRDMARRYSQIFPEEAEQASESASVAQRNSEQEHAHEQHWNPPTNLSSAESMRVVYSSSPSSSTLTLTPQVHESIINTSRSIDATVNTGADAGAFFHPLAPSRISVPSSTFSSLTGWDGSKGEEGVERGSSAVRGQGGACVRGGNSQGQGPELWYGWGTMQNVGLGGGGTWDGTAADVSVGASTGGGEGACGARGDGSGDVM